MRFTSRFHTGSSSSMRRARTWSQASAIGSPVALNRRRCTISSGNRRRAPRAACGAGGSSGVAVAQAGAIASARIAGLANLAEKRRSMQ
ncbi:MAG TPA: hypothetical protein VEY92_11760, partial [Pseudoxanthomonas sp.]|nr:hypothetical protein [Pseudoxanthomonas sp.]